MLSDKQLTDARDQLNQELGRQPNSFEIAQRLMATEPISASTVRGRFIQMGISLRSTAGQVQAAVNEHVRRVEDLKQEIKPVINIKPVVPYVPPVVVDDMKKYIPDSQDFNGYVERQIDKRLEVHYDIGPKTNRFKYPITQGKQGTGKTYSHAYYAYNKRLPFFLFSCYEDFRLQKIFGDKTIQNGSVMFQESLFVKAIQGPSVILFDEVNAISNSNSFDFHALLQNRELFIKDANNGLGFTYKLHPECRIGFAQNPKSAKYIGGSIKPSNFLGRCTFLTYPEFTEEDIKQLLGNKFPKVKKADIVKFVKFYFASLKIIEHAQLPVDISIRQLTNVVDLWHAGLELKDALNDGLICMLDAASQPAAKDAFVKASHAVWAELLPINLQDQSKKSQGEEKTQAMIGNATGLNLNQIKQMWQINNTNMPVYTGTGGTP